MLSIIIPTGNSFETKGGSIRHTLLALVEQKDIQKEVIVVVNNKGIEADYIQRWIRNMNQEIRMIVAKDANRPMSRNIGAELAKYDALLFMDDDTLLIEEHMLQKVFSEINGFDFALGAKRLWTKDDFFEKNADNLLRLPFHERAKILLDNSTLPKAVNREQDLPEFGLSRTFIASFGFIRRKIFHTLNGFEEKLDSFDDDLLMYKLFKQYNGISLAKHTVAHVNHSSFNIQEEFDKYHNIYKDILREDYDAYCSIESMKSLEAKLNTIIE